MKLVVFKISSSFLLFCAQNLETQRGCEVRSPNKSLFIWPVHLTAHFPALIYSKFNNLILMRINADNPLNSSK